MTGIPPTGTENSGRINGRTADRLVHIELDILVKEGFHLFGLPYDIFIPGSTYCKVIYQQILTCISKSFREMLDLVFSYHHKRG